MEKQSYISCPQCNQSIKDDLRFCPHCGCSLVELSSPKCCPNCGKIAPQGEKFCSDCGTAYTNTAKDKPCAPMSQKSKKLLFISGLSFVLVVAILLVVFLAIIPAQKENYTVEIYTYCENGIRKYETHKASITVKEGEVMGDISQYEGIHVNGIKNPKFKGWYTDKSGSNKWNPYVDKVQSDMTIYGIYTKP